MSQRAVTIRSDLTNGTIRLDLSSLSAQERSVARRAIEGLTRHNKPRIANVSLSPGAFLTCQAIVSSSRRRTMKTKSILTLVRQTVRRAVIHHREQMAVKQRLPAAAASQHQLRALTAPK